MTRVRRRSPGALGWVSSSTPLLLAATSRRIGVLLMLTSIVSVCNGQQQQEQQVGQLQPAEQTEQQQECQQEQYFLESNSNITINAGILLAEPFAYLTNNDNNDGNDDGNDDDGKTLVGFQIDLYKELQVIAKQTDNVNLNFKLDILDNMSYNGALDLIASDCNTTINPQPIETCQMYDMIIGDYWANPDRFERVEFTPSWLRTSLSTIKYIGDRGSSDADGGATTGAIVEYSTISETIRANDDVGVDVRVCVRTNSATPTIVKETFPNISIYDCDNDNECLDALKQRYCVLFIADELKLRYQARINPIQYEVTREQFRTQQLVWPLSRRRYRSNNNNLHSTTAAIQHHIKRWLYIASRQSIFDELFIKYFAYKPCPIGTSGINCDEPCHPIHGTSNRQGLCVCDSTRYIGNACDIERPTNLNLIDTNLKILGYLMFACNVVIVGICLLWLYIKRNTAQVRVSQPLFLSLVLLGCIVSSTTIIAMSQEAEGDDDAVVAACVLIPWFYSIGFCITFGTLFAKIYRISVLFDSAAHMRRTVISSSTTLSMIGIILLIDVILLTIWTIVDPLHWERIELETDKFGYVLESRGYCTSNNWQIFGGTIVTLHLILLLIASYCCYKARNITSQFSEGKFVAVAMISNLQIFIVGVPVLIIVGQEGNNNTAYFVRSAMVWMNDFMVVVLIFGNLMYSEYKISTSSSRREDNSNTFSNSDTHNGGSNSKKLSIRRAIREYRDSINNSSNNNNTSKRRPSRQQKRNSTSMITTTTISRNSPDTVIPVRRQHSLPTLPPATPSLVVAVMAEAALAVENGEHDILQDSSLSSSNGLAEAFPSGHRASATPLSMVAESASSTATKSDVEHVVDRTATDRNSTNPLSDTDTHSDVVLESPTSPTSLLDMTAGL